MADFPHLAAGRLTDPEGTIGFALAGPQIAVARTLAAVGQSIQGNVRNEVVRTAQLVEVLSDQLVTDQIHGGQSASRTAVGTSEVGIGTYP